MKEARNRQIVKNIATSITVTLANVIIFFFLTPYLKNQLGLEQYGVWFLILSLTGCLTIVQGSGTGAVTKYIAKYQAQNNQQKLEETINSALRLFLILTLLTLVAAIILCGISPIFNALHTDGQFNQNRLALIIMSANLILTIPFLPITATLNGLQRYDFNNFMQLCCSILWALGTVASMKLGYGLIGMAICRLTISLTSNIASTAFLFRIFKFRLSFKLSSRPMTWQLLNFGFFSFIMSISQLLFYRIDNLVISETIASPAEAITIYAIGFNLLETLRRLSMSALAPIMPVASELGELPPDKRSHKISELFARGMRFSLILSLPILLFLIIFGQQFFRLWLGSDYARQSSQTTYWIFVIMAIPQILAIAHFAGNHIVVGLAKHHFPAYTFLAMALLNLILSIILAKFFGVYGVAFGTAIPLVLMRCIYHIYFRQALKIPIWKTYWNACGRLLPITIGYIVLLMVQNHFLHLRQMRYLLPVAIINGLAFWLCSWWTLDSFERETAREFFRKLYPRR